MSVNGKDEEGNYVHFDHGWYGPCRKRTGVSGSDEGSFGPCDFVCASLLLTTNPPCTDLILSSKSDLLVASYRSHKSRAPHSSAHQSNKGSGSFFPYLARVASPPWRNVLVLDAVYT